ncbi:lytic murein transglycosylase B [Billgrantia gudaonensis]|uniref:Membrane-bound lytic murein transglycosylase B n=1 Tax=Billgrantia gudaonensis TaxID=376427 RepID=A0A1G8TE28_9GAMM|nr:lytic murein transglycosylase B [Halomonas gudaonensis]SDJ39647.1 membrane-bound lytic murein transglycosylase B [Halomonas gudaonensis]
MMPAGRWNKGVVVGAVVLTLWGTSSLSVAGEFDPVSHDGARSLVEELGGRGLERDWVAAALRRAVLQPGVLEAMAGAAERHLRWDEYRAIFLTPERIAQGVAFIDAHARAFERAEAVYGVPPEVIAAIIGVETAYGRHTGRHRVLDSLATLAFEHPSRGDFFRGELAAFLEITHEQEVDPGSIDGSYAGAMGYPQFIPTSYRAYAVDFDGDGQRDLWANPVDAIGSVGNYFAEHGWQSGAPIYHEAEGPRVPPDAIAFNRTTTPYAHMAELREAGVTSETALGDDQRVIPLALQTDETAWRYRLGRDNFHVITRYNHSHLYAMAVSELAEAIESRRELVPHRLEVTRTEREEDA